MSRFLVGDDLIVDSTQRQVIKDQVELSMPELSYRLLLALVENAPHIVSHDKLINIVWQDRVVSDENLKKRVSRLRESLADPSDSPKYFVAERGMGYRCIASVTPLAQSTLSTIDDAPPTSKTSVKSAVMAPSGAKTTILKYALIAVGVVTCSLLAVTQLTSYFKTDTQEKGLKIAQTSAQDYVFQAAQHYYRFTSNDNDKAMALYQQAIALSPNSSASYSGLSNSYSQGYAQFGKPITWLTKALDAAQTAITIQPKQAWGYHSQGIALYLGGRYSAALTSLGQASERSPNWELPIAHRALTHLAMGDVTLAFQLIQRVAKQHGSNPVVLTIQGLCFQELSMYKEAQFSFEQALRDNALLQMPQRAMGELALIRGENAQALERLMSLANQSPNYQAVHWLLGQYYLQVNDSDSATKYFEKTALLGGQYSLPAQVYVAVINQDRQQLNYLSQQIDNEINQGNRWVELMFAKGLISVSVGENSRGAEQIENAINNGFSHEYRLRNLHVLSTSFDTVEFDLLIEKIIQKNKSNRLMRAPV